MTEEQMRRLRSISQRHVHTKEDLITGMVVAENLLKEKQKYGYLFEGDPEAVAAFIKEMETVKQNVNILMVYLEENKEKIPIPNRIVDRAFIFLDEWSEQND